MLFKKIFLFFILLFISSCHFGDEFVDLKNVKTFEDKKVFFEYPANWEVEAFARVDAEDLSVKTLVITSERNSFITIQIFNQNMKMDVREFYDVYKKERNKQFNLKEKNIQNVNRTILGEKQKGLKDEFDKKNLGLDVPYLCEYYTIHTSDKTLTIIAQTPKEDSKQILKGFDLVFKSLSIIKVN